MEETAGRKWTLRSQEEDASGGTKIESMERCRRGKMNEKYAALQSMVPTLHPKAPKARIVEETIKYIEELEETVRAMEAAAKKKAGKRARIVSGDGGGGASASGSVDVTVSGNMAFFGVRTTWRPGLAARALQVFDDRQAEVLSAAVACDGGRDDVAGGGRGMMSLSVAAMADEAAVEGAEEELMAVLSSTAPPS